MRVIFVRHSEPDYSMLDRCENPEHYSGFGRDLAPLSEYGRLLARDLAKRESFQSADVIISSSITRALETEKQVKQRFLVALEKYRGYDTVIIVTHGMLMRQFVSQKEIAYDEILTVDL